MWARQQRISRVGPVMGFGADRSNFPRSDDSRPGDVGHKIARFLAVSARFGRFGPHWALRDHPRLLAVARCP
jgi:hypothetical protein